MDGMGYKDPYWPIPQKNPPKKMLLSFPSGPGNLDSVSRSGLMDWWIVCVYVVCVFVYYR